LSESSSEEDMNSDYDIEECSDDSESEFMTSSDEDSDNNKYEGEEEK